MTDEAFIELVRSQAASYASFTHHEVLKLIDIIDGLRERLEIEVGRREFAERAIESWRQAVNDTNERSAAAERAIRPAWSRDLDGYEPHDHDWGLLRDCNGVYAYQFHSGWSLCERIRSEEVIAYWRPPQPPPVPEGEQ